MGGFKRSYPLLNDSSRGITADICSLDLGVSWLSRTHVLEGGVSCHSAH